MLSVMVFGLAVLAGPSGQAPNQGPNHQFIHPNPNMATTTMGRFNDIDDRRWLDDYRREQVRRRYETAVINDRRALADQLDRLIAVDQCDHAVALSQRAGYRDIREGVARACDVGG